jgi:hypothetical protein
MSGFEFAEAEGDEALIRQLGLVPTISVRAIPVWRASFVSARCGTIPNMPRAHARFCLVIGIRRARPKCRSSCSRREGMCFEHMTLCLHPAITPGK